MIRLLFILTYLGVGSSAEAAKIVGNGGDVLVCPNRTPRVQLLDFVESRVLRKRVINLWNPPGETYKQKLEALVNNVEKRFPTFAANLRREITNFEEKNVKEYDIELEDINDSYHKLRLPGCHVEQIANQSIPMFDDDPWFLINATLWDQLEAFDKAGMVVHEVVYRIGLKYGLEHSVGVRYLVSLLFQEDLDRVTDQQWIQAFMHSRIKHYEVSNMRFPIFSGSEKSCEVIPGTVLCAGGASEIKPANILFTPDRSVTDLVYENSNERVDFRVPEMKASLYTRRMQFEKFVTFAEIFAEGRLLLSKVNGLDSMMIEVRGRINPTNGNFMGDYRASASSADQEQSWRPFIGNLKDLYDQNPPAQTLPRSR